MQYHLHQQHIWHEHICPCRCPAPMLLLLQAHAFAQRAMLCSSQHRTWHEHISLCLCPVCGHCDELLQAAAHLSQRSKQPQPRVCGNLQQQQYSSSSTTK
jgi:hypothetical protein